MSKQKQSHEVFSCIVCQYPSCMQKGTTSNAYKVCNSNPLSKENITVSTLVGYEAGLIDGAVQEREKMLKEVQDIINSVESHCYPHPCVEITSKLESLRKGA